MSKICLVSPYGYSLFYPNSSAPIGGAEKQSYLIAKSLNEKEHDVIFITGDYTSKDQLIKDGIELYPVLPISNKSYIRTTTFPIILFSWLKRINPDVMYSRGSMYISSLLNIYSKIFDIPSVYCPASDSKVDDLTNVRPGLKIFYRYALSQIDKIVVQSPKQQQLLKEYHDRDAIMIPNGVEIPPSKTLIRHEDRKYILWVGRLEKKQKRPAQFIRLAQEFPMKEFLLIGPPGQNEDYHNVLMDKVEATPNMDYLGRLPPDKVLSYFQKAQVLINTSRFEGFPNTFLEAWGFETPVISESFNLDFDFSEPSPLVHSNSFDRMVGDVERICSDVHERRSRGRNGRQFVREHCSLSSVGSQYNAMFKEVLDPN